MKETPSIGIDLGTTYSCVGIFQNGKIETIINDHGNRTTSSYVAFTNSQRLIGDAAKNQVSTNPRNTIFDTKRLIGRKFDEMSTQHDMKYWPFEVISDENRPKIKIWYKGESKILFPEEVASMMLMKMKEISENYLGMAVSSAVISVPASFNNSQRLATKEAAEIAGIKVLRIINEPTAAALVYGFERQGTGKRNVLIFDFGGGFLDVSVISIKDNAFKVRSTSGNISLGGQDFDNCLVEHFIQEFRHKHGKDLSSDKRAIRRLGIACERAKRTLSVNPSTWIEIDHLFEGIDFNSTLTRAQFEEITKDLFQKLLKPVEKSLIDAKLIRYRIDDVILVGGSTRIPKVQQLLKEFFKGKELNKTMNRDEAVAHGAAIQAAILNGNKFVHDLTISEITPLSLGIETVGNIMTTLIQRNASIPKRKSRTFTTYHDNQTGIAIRVFEGEREITSYNSLFIDCKYIGIPPAPRGVPQIEITFDVDENNMVVVSVKISEKMYKIIKNQEVLERMKTEAKKYCEDDTEENNRISAKIALETFAFNLQSIINFEKRGKLPKEKEDKILNEVEETIKWMDINEMAEKEAFVEKKLSLERIYNSIIESSENVCREMPEFSEGHISTQSADISYGKS